ncbi:MAG: NADH-quinone oxidoreductase subunit N [bacterium]|nr:NADH-quinone oxidoreductase subunit N [bacterium]
MDATALWQGAIALLPQLIVLMTGLVILVLDLFLTPRGRFLNETVAVIGLIIAFLSTLGPIDTPQSVLMHMAVTDNLSSFFNAIFLLIAVLTVLLSASYTRREGFNNGEYYALLLFATASFMFVAAAADLITIFLAVETLSIATYILAGLMRTEPRSQEAAFKYFMLGAFSSAIFLYGIATTYGAYGTTSLQELGGALKGGDIPTLFWAGMALLTVGLGFKVAAVPFHMWAPDVYEGAPTSVTAFMTAGPKAAAFAAFLRIFYQGFIGHAAIQEWTYTFVWLAALTMLVGNLMALAQRSVKRMLAYSSIAHAGYAFVALASYNALGASSILYYLMAYSLMSLGSFTVLMAVTKAGEQHYALRNFTGLGSTNPCLAGVMALFMFALAGFPPTAGFTGKFYLFSAAVQAGYYKLAILGMLTSVVSVFYYARIVIAMYMQAPDGEANVADLSPTVIATLAITVLGVLYMGIFPGALMRLASVSVQSLF